MDRELILPKALNREINPTHTPEELEERRDTRYDEDTRRENRILAIGGAIGVAILGATVWYSAGQTADNEAAKAQRNAAIVREYQISNQNRPAPESDSIISLTVTPDRQGGFTYTPAP